MKIFSLVLTIFVLVFSTHAFAQDLFVHKLRIAANPSVGVTDSSIDEIIDSMNSMIGSKSYSWDESCANVRFVRDGPVLISSAFLPSGSYQQLKNNLKTFAPTANVLVALSLTCDGDPAAGCGSIGGEPEVVVNLTGPQKIFNAQLWIHERGHAVGLQHSAEGPILEENAGPRIGRRIMFWMLGMGHSGKTHSECEAFSRSIFPSVAQVAKPPSDVKVAAATLPSLNVPSIVSVNDSGDSSDVDAQIQKAAAAVGLTVPAFKVVGIPWIGGPPREAMGNLSKDDIDSIRKIFDGPPNSYWTQAITTLAIVGEESDVKLIKNALNLPMPAAFPGDARGAERAIEISQIKIAAPLALGMLANRTKSPEAVESLKAASKVDRFDRIDNPQVETAINKNALHGLATSDTSQSRQFIQSVIKLQSAATPDEPVNKGDLEAATVVPTTKDERAALEEKISDTANVGKKNEK